jgi:hypothetical protein
MAKSRVPRFWLQKYFENKPYEIDTAGQGEEQWEPLRWESDCRYLDKPFDEAHFNTSSFLISWGWLRLSPLRMSATNYPIVPVPNNRWLWNSWWNEDWLEKTKYMEKTCPSATLSTENPTWLDLVSNPGRRIGKPATNRLSYGKAKLMTL